MLYLFVRVLTLRFAVAHMHHQVQDTRNDSSCDSGGACGLRWARIEIRTEGIARRAEPKLICLSYNGLCLVGRMSTHSAGVFCTHIRSPRLL
jgi:hypothetical protein